MTAQPSELSKKVFKHVNDICEGIPAEDVIDALIQSIGRTLVAHFKSANAAKNYVSGVAADIAASIDANTTGSQS